MEEAAEVAAREEDGEEFVVAYSRLDGAAADARAVWFGEAADGVGEFGETPSAIAEEIAALLRS